jgi:hypothetical protein
MKKIALIAVLLLATLPVAAQVVTGKTTGTSTGTSSGTSTGTTTGTLTGAIPGTLTGATGVFCTEEMLATFCNVPTAPNTNGWASSGATGSSGGASSNTSAIPTCPDFPPPDELCN